jgi:hypothetical protein
MKYERQQLQADDWEMTDVGVRLKGEILFPAPKADSGTATHLGIGTDKEGKGHLVIVMEIVPEMVLEANVAHGFERETGNLYCGFILNLETVCGWASLHTRRPLTGQDDEEVSYE